MSYAYTTPALVQSELQATTQFSETTYPSLGDVEEWIAEESAFINGLANQVFGSTIYSSEFIDYNGEEDLFLENAPIISISSLQYNANPVGSTLGPSWVSKTEDTHYTLYKDRGVARLLLDYWTPCDGSKRFCVTYSAGYEVVPLEITKLCTKLITERVLTSLIGKNVNERNDGGTVSIGSVSITEPASYGVQSFKQLKTDIDSLKAQLLTKGINLYRFAHI
jgi:hypothetical protein